MAQDNFDIIYNSLNEDRQGFSKRHDEFDSDILTNSGTYCRELKSHYGTKFLLKDWKGSGATTAPMYALDGTRAVSLRAKVRFDPNSTMDKYVILLAKVKSLEGTTYPAPGYKLGFYVNGSGIINQRVSLETSNYSFKAKNSFITNDSFFSKWWNIRMDIGLLGENVDRVAAYYKLEEDSSWTKYTDSFIADNNYYVPWDDSVKNRYGFQAAGGAYIDDFEIRRSTI